MSDTRLATASIVSMVSYCQPMGSTQIIMEEYGLHESVKFASKMSAAESEGLLKSITLTQADKKKYNLKGASKKRYVVTAKGKKYLKVNKNQVQSDEVLKQVRYQVGTYKKAAPSITQADSNAIDMFTSAIAGKAEALAVIKQIAGIALAYIAQAEGVANVEPENDQEQDS